MATPFDEAKFDLAKQSRIVARNRRMLMRAEQTQCRVIGAAAVGSVLLLVMLIWGTVHVALSH